MATRQGLNRGDESSNPSSDVDSIVPNLEHRLEYDDETDEVGEAQERNEKGDRMCGYGNLYETSVSVDLNESGDGIRLVAVVGDEGQDVVRRGEGRFE